MNFIHFVGKSYYTMNGFINEAKEHGASRRVALNVLKQMHWTNCHETNPAKQCRDGRRRNNYNSATGDCVLSSSGNRNREDRERIA